MLGELPFASRRNLLGLWNQILPELTMGLFSILTFFSSWKSAWTFGAAARFSLIRPSSVFRSAGASGSARRRGRTRQTRRAAKKNFLSIFRLVNAGLQRFFAPRLGFSRSGRW